MRKVSVSRNRIGQVSAAAASAAATLLLSAGSARATNYLFLGDGGASFNDAVNWTPASGPPTTGDVATIVSKISNLQDDIRILTLTMSSLSGQKGARIHTNYGNQLRVDGTLTIDGSGALAGQPVELRVHSSDVANKAALLANVINVIDGGLLNFETSDADLGLTQVTGTLTVDSASRIKGAANVELKKLVNKGVIEARSGKLTLKGTAADALDLDGTGLIETGQLDVTGGNLILDGDISDDFDGTLTVGAGHYVTSANFTKLTIGVGGVMNMNGSTNTSFKAVKNGNLGLRGVMNVDKLVDLNSNTDFEKGCVVNIPDADDFLTQTSGSEIFGGTFNGNGVFRTNSQVLIGDPNSATPNTITMNVQTWDWEGINNPSQHQTYMENAHLILNCQYIDTTHDGYDGELNMSNNSTITSNIPLGWRVDHLLRVGLGTSTIEGTQFTLNAVSIGEQSWVQGTLNMNAAAFIMNSPAAIELPGVNSTLNLNSPTTLNGAQIYGDGNVGGPDGIIKVNNSILVTADSSLGAGLVDLDGTANNSTITVNSGVAFSIYGTRFEDVNNRFRGTLNVNGGIVQVSVGQGNPGDPPVPWTLTAGGVINFNKPAAVNGILKGSNLRLGSNPGGGATINVNGSAEIQSKLIIGNAGAGINLMNVAAGATLTLNDFGSEANATVLKQGAGSIVVNGTQTHAAGSSFNLSGGAITLNSNAGGAANEANWTLSVNGTATFNTSQRFKTLNVQGTGKAQFSANGARVLRLDDLNIAGGATPTATVDLANNDMIVDYTAGNSPFNEIRDYLKAGYNHGNWNGTGINSFVAAALHDSGQTLGIIDNFLFTKAIFSGQLVDQTTVLVKYTWYGDLNLDGIVNATDQILLNPAGTEWYQGDMNYDGKVTPDDYALFALGASKYSGPLGVEVPEPAGLSLAFGAASVATLVRRRRAHA